MENIKSNPVLGPIINFLDKYPRIAAWVVLSVGIVGLLVYEARDVGLTAGNWAALIIASIAVAGLCIWIVSWEDDEDPEDKKVVVKSRNESDDPEAKVDTMIGASKAAAEEKAAQDTSTNHEDDETVELDK